MNTETMSAHVVTYSGTRTVRDEDDSAPYLVNWTHSAAYRSRAAAVRAAKRAAGNGFSDITLGKTRTVAFESNGFPVRRTEW